VSRPASPDPSSPSQVDTDSPVQSEAFEKGNNDDTLPSQVEQTVVTVGDTEVDERKAEKEANQARKKEEAKKAEQAREAHECWNFILPQLRSTRKLLEAGDPDAEWDFDILHLVSAVQNGEMEDEVGDYLQRCDQPPGSVNVNRKVGDFPAIFYAVEQNNEKMVQLFTRFGGDVRCFASYQNCHRVPLLGFAIINALRLEQPTSAMIATLLSLGATAEVIPRAFYDPFTEDLPVNGPRKEDLKDLDDPRRSWCESKDTRKHLAKALDFTQRYYLHKSTIVPQPVERHRQVTQLQNAEPLWEVPYLLIGQIPAATMVIEQILNSLVIDDKKPMVLVFAGNYLGLHSTNPTTN
jgi:hypothetical protein